LILLLPAKNNPAYINGMRVVWHVVLPALAFAILPSARALILEGTIKDPDERSIRVFIRMNQGAPQAIDLDYSPIHLPADHNEAFSTPATRNGVDGSEYTDLENQHETLSTHFRFFGINRLDFPKSTRPLMGKFSRNELVTFQYSAINTYFTDNVSAPILIARDTTPYTETKVRHGVEDVRMWINHYNPAISRVFRSTDKSALWIFDIRPSWWSNSSSVDGLKIKLRQIRFKTWRITLSTTYTYPDTDVSLTLTTRATGFLRIR